LTFPDYQGNNMFQTLGNLTADPVIGLLFVDWNSGRTLQLAGNAEIVWDAARLAIWPRAERLVDVRIARFATRAIGPTRTSERLGRHDPPLRSSAARA
jgi:uncharacterized protein